MTNNFPWFLNSQLFGTKDENEEEELSQALKDGENGEFSRIYLFLFPVFLIVLTDTSFISLPPRLLPIADEINSLRREAQEMKVIHDSLTSPDSASKVFNKVFKADTERLLGMEDMWKNREKPTPLDFDSAKVEKKEDEKKKEAEAGTSGSTLKDQRVWTLKECAEQFEKR